MVSLECNTSTVQVIIECTLQSWQEGMAHVTKHTYILKVYMGVLTRGNGSCHHIHIHTHTHTHTHLYTKCIHGGLDKREWHMSPHTHIY